MKYLLFVLALFFQVSPFLTAQDDYLPTAIDGANWVVFDSETPHYPYFAFVRTIDGDTLVNNRMYKKLYQHIVDYKDRQGAPAFAPPYTLLPGRELIALLRDDGIERKVYGMVTNTSSSSTIFSPDALLHDYSLQEGDTLRGLNFETLSHGALVVTEIGSEDQYGEIRRYQLSNDGHFYEGVGSEMYGPTSGGSGLNTACCIFALKDYCVGEFSECNLVLTPVTELNLEVSIKTHPNPFTTHLNFLPSENVKGEPFKVVLREMTGRIIRQGELGTGLQWPTQELPPGMYTATYTSGAQRATVKLIKQ